MTLTERQKEEIIKNNKSLAKNHFEMKRNELERILRNYNVQRVDNLKKASLDSRNYDEEEEKEETSKK